jgi:hypothetical protein
MLASALELSGFAQICPRDGVDTGSLSRQMERTSDVMVVYRAAAIAQHELAPALHKLSKPGMPLNSIPGAAQVSLARLGDKEAIEQLRQELEKAHSPTDVHAIDRLVRVGDDNSIAILMNYLIAHLSDASLAVALDDAGEDLRQYLINAIAVHVQVGPLSPNGRFSVALPEWVSWWEKNPGRPITLSISNDLKDPYLRCLARKVEWGFPNAVLDLANDGGQQVVPILKRLTTVGDSRTASFSLGTFRGNATAGLAKLGDEDAFRTIVSDLDGPGYRGAIEELRLINGRKAIEALINALGSEAAEQHKRNTHKGHSRSTSDRSRLIFAALNSMVADPPRKESQTLLKWKEWWEKNRGTAKFNKTMPQYE